MRRMYNLARGSQVPARLLNGLQDEQLGLIAATDTADGATAVALAGADGRWWTSPTAGVPDGELRVLDTSVDWRSRRVWGVFRALGAATRRPGQADDHIPNDPTAAPNARMFNGWTGSGGLGAAAATVANGTPPTIADDQYAVLLDEGATTADRVWLYARDSDGALCLYNDSGAALHAELIVWGAAAAPTLGTAPSAYPSPVYVLWLTPTTAALRPVTPDPVEQIAIHRATDTGAVTLWDGGAWRTIGLVSPLTTRGDLWVRDGSGDARLAVGGASEILGSDGTDPVYRALDEFIPSAQVSTTDDTWTTVATITTDAELAIVETHFSVVARKDDWSEGGAWRGTVAHRRYGGAYNAMGSVAWQPNFSENALLDVRVTEDASGVYIQVKGPPATDYRWQVKYLRNVLES